MTKAGKIPPPSEKINYRLIQEWEVPQWIEVKVEEPEVTLRNEMEQYGLGKRKRAEVNYREEMSESQWLQIIEDGGDPQ